MFSGQAKKLSRMVAERDEWLLIREAKIRSLEADISRGEEVTRDQIDILEAGIKKAEEAGQKRVKSLESEVKQQRI